MARSVIVGALLVAAGAAAALVLGSYGSSVEPAASEPRAATAPRAPARGFGAPRERGDDDRERAAVARRVEALEAKVAADAAERRRMAERLEALSAQVAALPGGSQATAPAVAPAPPSVHEEPAPDPAEAPPVDESLSPMERALAAAGLDAESAADIKRRHDELAMAEMYLRNQATREEWLDSPRFAEEMEAIEAQRTSIRDEIGDDAYDRYLFALGHTNRVRVDEVFSQSPAAQAGVRPHDMILRYGPTRVFGPDDLVAETSRGTVGEMVPVEIIRNGERVNVEVPRGPLGIRVAATQAEPTS